ncbi:hypothetical protein VaNZ11_009518 [Volvox africanus]|uniref:HAUS augmin-like complex subunit 6 N-terminal domain-containing protein n=1 Tax=Volvox africanus TaxID=51714 RepID=A0ABQ5S7R0_9CHLO|nr:hypothetical protein VaNZ11_009518 [Volvox africanus]
MRAALATSGKLEVPTLEEQALYHNLCILGIVHPSLRQEGIDLSRTAFRRSNNKALEYVLYRLYIIIEGKSRAQKDFKGMLPVLDKLQQAPFYQRIGDWMAELKKSGRLEPSVILPVSALKTNTSNRLILLLLELSTVALHQDAEATCQGIIQTAYMPPLGSAAASTGGSGGLLDDPLIPAEMRLGVSTTRAKQACTEFLASAASASSVCDAMEQRCLAFKKRYYELQAEIRQQHIAMAELPEGTLITSSSQSHMAADPSSMDVSAGTDPTSQMPSIGALSNGTGASQQPPTRRSPHHGLPNPEKAAALSALLAGLDEHLRVHKELSEALMMDADGSCPSGNAGAGPHRVAGFVGDSVGIRYGQATSQQMLHPHQIDGKTLTTEALVAAAASAGPDAGARVGNGAAGFEQQSQRRQQKNMLMPYGPDNIVKAFISFASLLSSLAPHVTQLAMAGENAGPSPLLQPASHPSGHAAHVAHQLQVHGSTSRQIAQLSRRVQEQAAACGTVLRALRLESNRAISHRCDFSGHDCLDDDFLDMGPHLALPPALPQPVPQMSGSVPSMTSPRQQATSSQPSGPGATGGASSGAHSVVVMGSPCPSSASAQMVAVLASGASGCASANNVPPTSTVVATSTATAQADDGLAKIHARLRSLSIGQPTVTAAAVANTVNTAPVSATSARAITDTAMANAAMSMFSPPATLHGLGSSPIAISGATAGPTRPPLSTTTQTPYDLSIYTQMPSGSKFSPLRNASGQQNHIGSLSGGNGLYMQPSRANGLGANGYSETGNSTAWLQMPWLGSSAPSGAPVLASTASQARAAGFGWPSSSVAAPGWMSPQQHQPQQSLSSLPDSGPSSRRALDTLFRQQQQQQQEQSRIRLAHAGGFMSGPLADRSGNSSSGSGATSSCGTAAAAQRQHSESDGTRPAETSTGSSKIDIDRASAKRNSSRDVPPVSGSDAAHAVSGGSSQAPVEPGPFHTSASHGHLASGGNRKVDLRSLLDDEDEDKDLAHFLSGYRAGGPSNGGIPDARLGDKVPGGFAAPRGFPDARPTGGTTSGSSHGILHADADADFGILAAEGEFVSQALMFGGPAATGGTSYSPHVVGAGAAAAASADAAGPGSAVGPPFGAPLAEGSSGAWGSSCGGAMADAGDDRDRGPSAGGVSAASFGAQSSLGLMEIDNGDDVIMVDNNKDASPGFRTKGAPTAGWPSEGVGATASGVQCQNPNSLFDAFGALISPQASELHQQGPSNKQPYASSVIPAVQSAVAATTEGGFGAEILALKARMQAAMTKQ